MRKSKPASETQPLDVLLSSRCRDEFPDPDGKPVALEKVRRELKRRLEAITLGGRQVYRVWIHEDESDSNALVSNWEKCLEKSRAVDVFLALYNGRAGWLGANSPAREGVGICHAELEAAFNQAPSKVRCIFLNPPVSCEAGSPDARFQDYVSGLNLPGAQVRHTGAVFDAAERLAAAIVLGLAREGVGINSSGGYYAGEALEWSRMNFQTRRERMTAAVAGLLRGRGGPQPSRADDRLAVVAIRGVRVGFLCDGIPAALGIAAARELVGQPFLRDHERTGDWDAAIAGPVHLIACQKNVTESQALRQLGFPDAVVVAHPFGIYVADEAQKIQMAFIANCRDETTTRKGVQTFLNWLNEHGEVKRLVSRAQARRRLSDFMRGL